MSLVTMPRSNKQAEILSSFFSDFPVTEEAVQTRTKIGDFGDKLARITMKGDLRAGGIVAPSEYQVNLASGYRFEKVGVVIAALWKVVRQEIYEHENGRKFALFYSGNGQALETPEDVFSWYDSQQEEGLTRDLSIAPQINPGLYNPNIYIASGIAELIKYGNFKEPNTDD